MNRPGLQQRLISMYRVGIVGAHNLLRNAWLTTAAIAVMVVTLTIVFFGALAYKTLDDSIDNVSRLLTVAIYLEDTDAESVYEPLQQDLERLDSVDSVSFKSKGEALRDFQDRFAQERSLIAGTRLTEDNPLPASFDVVMNDVSEFQQVIDIANQDQYGEIVSEARFTDVKQDAFNTFITLRGFFGQASVIGGIIFGAISVLIIFNTIRMAIFTRSNEIEIMKLIGATRNYIRGPFLVEAALYGVIAGVIALVAIYSAVLAIEPELGSDVAVSETMELLTERWPLVFLVIVGSGVMIGFLSSLLATSRYLRLKKW